MKSFLVLVYFLFPSVNYFSQTISAGNYQQPEFPGKRAALYAYLNQYLFISADDSEKRLTGINLETTIYITKDGKVKFVNVTGQNSEFKNQVKRVLTLMPDWSSGVINGAPVDTFVTQKIWFTYGESRIKKDSVIYEYRLYEVPLSDKKNDEWEKKRQERVERLAKAKELYNNAALEFNNSNFKEAARLFEEARINGLVTKELYFNLAVAQIKAGDKQSACPNFKEAARKGDQESYLLYLKMCK